MEPVMACLPSFLNLRGHPRLCTQRCTGSGDAAALRRHSLTHSLQQHMPVLGEVVGSAAMTAMLLLLLSCIVSEFLSYAGSG
jgi:hypothetical protein